MVCSISPAKANGFLRDKSIQTVLWRGSKNFHWVNEPFIDYQTGKVRQNSHYFKPLVIRFLNISIIYKPSLMGILVFLRGSILMLMSLNQDIDFREGIDMYQLLLYRDN
ncbi:hypothetical protein BHR79_01070 [Methanohalophilus halophilus]|uniref:Uncharacterized protein n=1 Tax=Methanohalophilus halophilus TaxID=2177 RepID=A0A1L3Q011_9EURY|nr:hypothetical protein BHR79_01070 [Methanohalophilus halophilus]RNI10923.1 hypothetical protein EFE40_01725 [Methanohalophilus halophilus]